MEKILDWKKHLKRTENLKENISAINKLLLKVEKENELYDEICNILVKNHNYKLVWIALKEENFNINPIAQRGFEKNFLSSIKIKWDDSQYSKGPTGQAIITGKPQVFQNIVNNPKDLPYKEEALKRGFRSSAAIPIKYNSNIIGALNVFSDYVNIFDEDELKFLEEVSGDITLGVMKIRSSAKLKNMINGTIEALSIIHKFRDPFTSTHQNNVAKLSIKIAEKMSLPKNIIDGLDIACLLHDIGKIVIEPNILNKPSKLNGLEYDIIKEHPIKGYEILKNIGFPWPVAKINLQHHERLDGSGYPYGIKKKDILIETQILMVADIVEAMMSHRPYRPALDLEIALREISVNKGKLFNPEIVDYCIEIFKKENFKFDNLFYINDWIT